MSKSRKQVLRCNQCGRELIFVGRTETKDTFSKVVTTIYRCPDKECQKTIDKKTRARIKLQKEQASAKKARVKSKMRLNTKMRLNKRKILR